MSNPVLLLPATGAGGGVAKYIAEGPVGVDERRHVNCYVKDDQLCNYLPQVCVCISHLYQNVQQQKTINTVIATDLGAFLYCLFTAATTLELLHSKSTRLPVSCLPHTTQLRTIGTNSFAMILMSVHSGGQDHWNQFSIQNEPQPHVPDASV